MKDSSKKPVNFAYGLIISTRVADKFLQGKKGEKHELLVDIDGLVHILTIFQLKKALKRYRK